MQANFFDTLVLLDQLMQLIFIKRKIINITFLSSYSCGYKRVFEEYVGILRQKYPELHIHGENYDPPGYNMFIAKFLVSLLLFLKNKNATLNYIY